MATLATTYISDLRQNFARLKSTAERALDQVDEDAFFQSLGGESNSIAVIVKHLAGNMQSRWTDFRTSDGEKPDRNRDQEFIADRDTMADLMKAWEAGWSRVFEAIDSLSENELTETIYIRKEPHSIVEAMDRSLAHVAYHVGQIVMLAKHYSGDAWKPLTIPRGESDAYNARMMGP